MLLSYKPSKICFAEIERALPGSYLELESNVDFG